MMRTTKRMWRVAGLLVLALLIAGCVYKVLPLSARYVILDGLPPEVTPLSRPVILVADDQQHHLYGDPFWMRSEFTARFVRTAIRPVQLDLYGLDLIRWMLERNTPALPVIHLGDALDIACTDEFDTFRETMALAQNGWVMAPGNHDSFFFGNVAHSIFWPEACQRGGKPMTKDIFVSEYLRAIAQQDEPGAKELRRVLAEPLQPRGSWHYQGTERAFLRRVRWDIDAGAPWRSYIVQQVDLTSVHSNESVTGILLDTTQYRTAPQLVPAGEILVNAGVTGEMLEEQLSTVEEWLKQGPPKQVAILMGHHPFGDLTKAARAAVARLRTTYPIMLFISAHTHAGRFYVRGEESTWLELNLGSILDWPPEYRTLRLYLTHPDERDQRHIIVDTPLSRINEIRHTPGADDMPVCDERWEAKPTDPDYYVTYMSGTADAKETHRKLMTVLLHSYKRLLKEAPTVPCGSTPPTTWPPGWCEDADVQRAIDTALESDTDAKIELLVRLAAFEKRRVPEDPGIRRDFRMCQALWASQYAHLGARAPTVDNRFIQFPRE